ncbi:EF-P lysine aminoacylase EpmA [Pseudogemmobacter faecipullorum]|uniref:EF-P lysine aminoacylase GenX n=1 Tax=Pseudogemmobacter faecipullorum TaxID=2755041 RepID=A0ABS8CIT3_9RHOB|nr:EF-P lysine aminoacylase EpmA [Pseudogemmobacter faecipullorum]MCB5409291.1 EF-P lysine aminoacylase GenX [Pseudogemmobacter faecipullorum]
MTRNASETPWWHPSRHADRRPVLLARGRIASALRRWFEAEDFLEVDPSALQVSPGNEAHLHAFRTTLIGEDGAAREMYLHTSPEFAMKRLLAAGETRIFSLGHVWRNRERGQRHSPEFTMLEWYRVGADYTRLMEDIAAWAQLAVQAAGTSMLRKGDLSCDPALPFERLSVLDAFARYAGIDLAATMDARGATSAAALAAQMDHQGISHMAGESWSDLFSRILSERVEQHLGQGRLTVLDLYPAAEAALARRVPGDPRLAERFEVYACGVELANGFGELTDADEQRLRFQEEMAIKRATYGEDYPIDEDFLAALRLMPDAAGCALGFDRLVMLATAAPRVEDVIWVPVG